MPLPKKHRAALVKEFGKPLIIEEVPTPEPRGRQVLIKVVSAGICHTDVHVWKGDWAVAGIPPKLPFIISHEIIGTVIAKGDEVPEDVKEGRKVLVYSWQWAKDDVYVLKGLTQLSDHPVHLGITVEGGLQEYFLVSDYRFLVDVEGLDDVVLAAPLACAGLTTYRAVKKILPYLEPDDYVVVVGLGGLGGYAVQWVKALAPYVNIVGVDVKEEAIDFVSKILKLDIAINASKVDPAKSVSEITRGKGAKAVIDIVGTSKTVGTYINVLAKAGIYVLVGMMGIEVTIAPLLPFIVSEKTITGSIVGTLAEQIEVVNAAKRGAINYKAVVSRKLRFEEATEGLEALEKGKVLGRQVIVF